MTSIILMPACIRTAFLFEDDMRIGNVEVPAGFYAVDIGGETVALERAAFERRHFRVGPDRFAERVGRVAAEWDGSSFVVEGRAMGIDEMRSCFLWCDADGEPFASASMSPADLMEAVSADYGKRSGVGAILADMRANGRFPADEAAAFDLVYEREIPAVEEKPEEPPLVVLGGEDVTDLINDAIRRLLT